MAKGPDAFRTISEAADEIGVPQHVLRFWETRFSFIRPMKRAGGRRFYRPQDVAVLRGVKRLLHDDGYTIKGVQKLHKDEGLKRLLASEPAGRSGMPKDNVVNRAQPHEALGVQGLRTALADLLAAKRRLDDLLGSSVIAKH